MLKWVAQLILYLTWVDFLEFVEWVIKKRHFTREKKCVILSFKNYTIFFKFSDMLNLLPCFFFPQFTILFLIWYEYLVIYYPSKWIVMLANACKCHLQGGHTLILPAKALTPPMTQGGDVPSSISVMQQALPVFWTTFTPLFQL